MIWLIIIRFWQEVGLIMVVEKDILLLYDVILVLLIMAEGVEITWVLIVMEIRLLN